MPWTAHSAVCVITVSYTWQRPASEATASSANQKILSLLCNLKVHHRAQDSPTLVRIVNQINPITTFQPNPIKGICNIIESTTITLKSQLTFKFPQPKLSCFSHPCHLCLWYVGPTNNCEDYKSRSSSLCSFLSLSVISSILSPSIWQLFQGKDIIITEVFWMWSQNPSNCDSSTQRGWHNVHTWDQITFRRS